MRSQVSRRSFFQNIFLGLIATSFISSLPSARAANKRIKHKLNISGPWYVTDPDDDSGQGCIACNVCYTAAPEFFKEDKDSNAYVWNMPVTANEKELYMEQFRACPVEAIGIDG